MLARIVRVSLLLVICGLLLSIAVVVPSYAQAVTSAHRYQVALASTPPDEASLSESFGRQLDTLTSLYSTVITVLSILLAAVAGLAAFSTAFVSRARAAETARDESKAYRESEEYKALLRQEIQHAVEKRLAERLEKFTALAETMQQLYEENDLQVTEPDQSAGADEEELDPDEE